MLVRYVISLVAIASVTLGIVLRSESRTAHAAEHPSATPAGPASLNSTSPDPGSTTTLSMTTQEHLRASSWWPTKPLPNLDVYAGTAACARCHAGIVASQQHSQMARTLGPASQSAVLNQHRQQQYHAGPYTYSLARKASDLTVTVTDGAQQQTALLAWAIGSGDVGQSYLWQQDGAFRETRFNYFATLGQFDATPGRLHGSPTSIDMALGRPIEGFEVRTCFSCHTTAMSSASPLDVQTIVPGVSCEVCHGPGRAHIAAAEAHIAQSNTAATQAAAATSTASSAPPADVASWDRKIVNSARLSPTQSVDYCGSCHSTPWDVRLMGAVGVQTVRFPAYRLEKSRCWGPNGDPRLTCTACHDPHAPLEKDPSAYDSACLDCHATKGSAPSPSQSVSTPSASTAHTATDLHPATRPLAPACPVATTRCVSCHMPKSNLPEMHYSFTDHNIRIARANAPFPD